MNRSLSSYSPKGNILKVHVEKTKYHISQAKSRFSLLKRTKFGGLVCAKTFLPCIPKWDYSHRYWEHMFRTDPQLYSLGSCTSQ